MSIEDIEVKLDTLCNRVLGVKKTVLDKKAVVGGANSADDVVSESTTAGTPWVFSFGGTGYIVKAQLISATNAITPRATLFLFTKRPSCVLEDNVTATCPNAADTPYLVGQIDFPAMTDVGTGHSYATATPSTSGNLPLYFSTPVLYGVLVSLDAATWGAALVTIRLSVALDAA